MSSIMSPEHRQLVIAALLHDIGRFRQRALGSAEHHTELAANWLEQRKVDKAIIELVRNHHEEDSFIHKAESILYGAKAPDESVDYLGPLISIFSRIRPSGASQQPPTGAYGLHTLGNPSATEDEHPVAPPPAIHRQAYMELWEAFEQEFEHVREEMDVDRLLILLEKYTSFIPDCAAYPDIPLFDHLKLTAALVSCLATAEDRHRPFLQAGGDFSGVQKFVYTISSKGALRTLRGRSFFLELLTEHVIDEILRRSGLWRVSMLWSGGARFSLLLPNSAGVKKVLKEVREGTNKYLLASHDARLCLILEWEIFPEPALSPAVDDKVVDRISRSKARKFAEVLAQPKSTLLGPFPIRRDECHVCQSSQQELCKKRISGADVLLCGFCAWAYAMGAALAKLPRTGGVLEQVTSHSPVVQSNYVLRHQPTGQASATWHLNEYNLHRFRPGDKNLLLANYVVDKDFEKMAESAVGANDLAALRMDVDSLGKLFSKEWLGTSTGLIHRNVLSRRLDYFFKFHVKALCDGKNVAVVYSGGDDLFVVGAWSDVADLCFDIREAFKKYTGRNPYVNISGGFTTGPPKYPLYRLAELAYEAEKSAKENRWGPDDLLKDSVALFYKTPVILENGSGSGSPTLVYAIRWQDATGISAFSVRNLKKKMLSAVAANYELKLPRSLLFKLYDVIERKKTQGQLHLPMLAYVLAKCRLNLNGKVERVVWKDLEAEFLRAGTVNYLQPVLLWLEMLTRKEGKK